MKSLLQSIAVVAVGLFMSMQVHATAVALELQLMIDTSGSVDQSEFILQRDGYVAAFNSVAVHDAIIAVGNIAVSVAYFSTTATPGVPMEPGVGLIANPQIGWTQLSSAMDAMNFATLIMGLSHTDNIDDDDDISVVPSGGTGETNIADALQFGISAFNNNDFEGNRRVIDVSTDGVQNTLLDGTDGTLTCLVPEQNFCTDIVSAQRDLAAAAGITVNALAINPDDLEEVPPADILALLGLPPDAGIDDYLNAFVITDDGFVLSTNFDGTFADTITQKITREISPIPIPAAFWLFGSALGILALRNKRIH